MKREIKFRAWDRVRKIIVNVVMLSFEQDVLGFDDSDAIEYGNTRDFELMQYTGLKDVNGVEIYEGDIMRAVPVRRQYPTAFSLKEHVGTLVIGSQRLTISGKTYDKELYDYEVIGNKFENPKLLEG